MFFRRTEACNVYVTPSDKSLHDKSLMMAVWDIAGEIAPCPIQPKWGIVHADILIPYRYRTDCLCLNTGHGTKPAR